MTRAASRSVPAARDAGAAPRPGGPGDAVDPDDAPDAPPAAPDPGARIRVLLRDAPRRTARLGTRIGRGTWRTWQRSLTLRVGVTTVVITGVAVLLIGVFLVDKLTHGILHAKRNAAVSQARIGLEPAQQILRGVGPQGGDLNLARTELTSSLTAGGSSTGLFSISIEALSGSNTDAALEPPPVPSALREAVRSDHLAVQYAPVHPKPNAVGFVPGLIVGEPITTPTADYALYYSFPLTAEQQTISLVQRTVWLAGLGIVVLVLAIALLVTRQVVRPVRVAAETAGRLAGGDLSKRIKVRGSDDIARLGRSFNDMADSLQRQIRRLEDLSRLQRRFTSDVSHELRTPLTTIRMASEFLYGERAEFPPELARSTELLQTELDRFELLLGDLLEVSRYDAGVAKLDSEPSDIRAAVARSIEATRMLAERHGSAVVVNQPDAAVLVDMDVRRIERILRNLLGNALDHGEGNPVVITIAPDANSVAITVRDHGVGLRPGEAALVFNRFWRGDPSRSRLTGGTGLGLAIALEDARLHDGWLQAWGEAHRGAQFRLTLPLRAGHTLMHSPLSLDPDEVEELDE